LRDSYLQPAARGCGGPFGIPLCLLVTVVVKSFPPDPALHYFSNNAQNQPEPFSS
jgi:hypothetical protein